VVVLVVLVLLVVAAIGIVALTAGDDPAPAASAAPPAPADAPTPDMLALQVNGAPAPLLAVIGVPDEGTSFVMPWSSELTVVVPGQGETSTAGVAALPPASMGVALSNTMGVWIDHQAVLTLRDLGAAIDAADGVQVVLSQAYPTTAGDVGPGQVTMTGDQARSFLAGATDDASVRWEILLTAMLADPVPLSTAPDADLSDPAAVDEVLVSAQGAEVVEMPTERVTSTIVVPNYPALDEIVSTSLGTPVPVGSIVQNGSGEPGVGETVAERIVPAGFRVVLSQNAQTFDVERTDIFANGPEHEGEARAVQEALGVGRVRVAAVPSNVGDITIVVGKDFTA
jgi:hypothetical protein